MNSYPFTLAVLSGLFLSSLAHAQEQAPTFPMRLEAERAQLSGVNVATERNGYSGSGYVTGFDNDRDHITFSVPISRPGMYSVRIRFSTDMEKGFELSVNGDKTEGMFPNANDKFAWQDAGIVELRAGTNQIQIIKNWGWYDIDALEIAPATSSQPLKTVPLQLADTQANRATRQLMQRLINAYGQTTFSGQYDVDDTEYVRQTTGKTPAIFASDLIEFSPSRRAHGADPKGVVEEAIHRAQNGQILTLSWHWNAPGGLIDGTYTDKNGKKVEAPWWRGFDADATTFDVRKALANPQSQDYKLLLRDIDAIAVQLKRLDAAGVPVLWRPLHEADGAWFWWGSKGPAPFKALWKLMFERLTVKHGLHNLIWVYTGTPGKWDWYPGDNMVDIWGIDSYPDDWHDTLVNQWQPLVQRFDGKKLLALTEFKGAADIDKARHFGVRWSYFVSWTDDLGPKKQLAADLKRIYNSNTVTNR